MKETITAPDLGVIVFKVPDVAKVLSVQAQFDELAATAGGDENAQARRMLEISAQIVDYVESFNGAATTERCIPLSKYIPICFAILKWRTLGEI